MKRILIFSLAYSPHEGGAEIAIRKITDRISDIEFDLLTLNFGGEPKEEKIGNVVIHRLGNSSSYLSKILFIPRAARDARAMHRARPFDGFWAMMSYMTFPIVLLRFVGIRVPYLLTLQEGDPWEHMFTRWFILPFRPLLSSGFKHASVVQVISTYLATWARRMGYTTRATEVVPNGFDAFWFGMDMSGQDRRSFWKQHHVNDTGTILITTSRLVKKNGIDTVIQAMPLLPTTVNFVVLGEGKDRKKLEALARQLNVADRVHFMGNVSNSTIIQYLHPADIFIRPSRSEGMGNSFIEAMAAGVPVIATQEGGIADFLFDATRNPEQPPTGWAVDKDSPKQIADAVQDIIARPEQVARVTATAKALVLEKYDWNLIAARMRVLFDQLLESR